MGRILWHYSQRVSIQLLLFFLLLNPFCAVTQDWPSWRGPNRNGITEDKNWAYQTLTDKPKILWQRNVGKGYSSVTVVGDYLFTMGNTDLKIKYCALIQEPVKIFGASNLKVSTDTIMVLYQHLFMKMTVFMYLKEMERFFVLMQKPANRLGM